MRDLLGRNRCPVNDRAPSIWSALVSDTVKFVLIALAVVIVWPKVSGLIGQVPVVGPVVAGVVD